MTEASDPPDTWRTRVRAAPTTTAIGVLCCVGFLATLGVCTGGTDDPGTMLRDSVWSLGACQPALVQVGALELARVWVDGEWWRVVSTGLLHGSWIHLILNIWSLLAVGEWAERTWGGPRLAVLFALSSVTGCLASLAWAEAPMVVGASAGIFGIAGALLVARVAGSPSVRSDLEPISVGMLGGCLVVLLAIGFFVPVIAQAGHIGGLVAGVLLGWAWTRPSGPGARIGTVLVGVVCAGLVQLGAEPGERGGAAEFLGYRQLELGDFAAAVVSLDQALEQRPDDPGLENAIAYALAEADVELDRAFELVQRALEDEPDNADFLDTLGWIECRRGNIEAGLAALDAAEAAADEAIPEVETHRAACHPTH